MDDVASRTRPHGARPILPHHLATLVQQASYRHVQLLIMSPGQGAGGRVQGAGYRVKVQPCMVSAAVQGAGCRV